MEGEVHALFLNEDTKTLQKGRFGAESIMNVINNGGLLNAMECGVELFLIEPKKEQVAPFQHILVPIVCVEQPTLN